MAELSDAALKLMRYLQSVNLRQGDWELPGNMEPIFASAEECERAQEELGMMGYVVFEPDSTYNSPMRNRIRALTVTLDGERFLAQGLLP